MAYDFGNHDRVTITKQGVTIYDKTDNHESIDFYTITGESMLRGLIDNLVFELNGNYYEIDKVFSGKELLLEVMEIDRPTFF